MDLLLRELNQRHGQNTEYSDTEVRCEEISLGSRPDQTIQILGLDVNFHHASLKKTAKGVQLSCRRGCKVMHQGRSKTSALLSEGDVLEIGGNCIRVIHAPPGFDLALELKRSEDVDSKVFEGAYRTQLTQTWLSKRLSSWFGLILVLLLFLGLPLLGLLFQHDNRMFQQIPLPSDRLWSSGPLLSAHKVAIGDDCSACHVTLFKMVADKQCLNCHDGIADHVASSQLKHQVGLDSARCASCHREHNEPPHITIDADRLCTDCHYEGQQTSTEGVELAAVSGFDLTTHPAFKVQLLRPHRSERGTGVVFDWQASRSPVPDAAERSNLKFPHSVHLNAAKVRNASNDAALECDDCHRLSRDNEHFNSITMEGECQACHELTFDSSDPQRQLPHGKPNEAVLAMKGHFLLKYADPDSKHKTLVRRRLPGRNREEQGCRGNSYDCAVNRTAVEVANQFTKRGCITCHEVSSNENAGLHELSDRYQVWPVRLAEDYYPWAKFDHRSHLTQENKSGSAACLSCHKAADSDQSSDVLIPDIENCVSCHGDDSSNKNLLLHCSECHSFHLEEAIRVDTAS